ncbi:hypothetical protein [Runella sp. SP2]|uniref:hypothetical protein n=1 Tax=Runella sp. SP2 TaxID=2268026 RepID=UPI000F07F2AB|nr:hypothetical protein [Runella sp. SP2]AYQ31390.1 hypothetical protein DTQ70_03995 [Runella sp. SP2]
MKKDAVAKVKKAPKSLAERFEDDFDAIYRYYTNSNSNLSEKQFEQLERWRWCREWYLTYQPSSNRELVSVLITQFGISEKQAYIDVQNTMRFFASMEKVNKEAEKAAMVERLKRRQKKMDDLAEIDLKAAGEANKADKLLADVLGFMEPENVIPSPVIVHIFPVFDPTLLGFDPIENLEHKLRIFKEKKRKEAEIVDVDFDEIMDNPYAIQPSSTT